MAIDLAFADEHPVFQATSAATDRAPVFPHKLVAIHLGNDLHDPSINGIALTGQLGQLGEEHLKPFAGKEFRDFGRCGR